MQTNYLIAALIAGAIAAGCATPQPRGGSEPSAHIQPDLSPEQRRILDSGDQFILLSLNPTLPEKPVVQETFHQYAVLGKTPIRDQTERAALLGALYQGIAGSGDDLMACFKPRHGIHATLAGQEVDLVICFECRSIQVYSPGETIALVSDSPRDAFNRALRQVGLPIAK